MSTPKKGSRSSVREITDEGKKERIVFLQSEVAQLERKVEMEEERAKQNVQKFKELEKESRGMVENYLFRKEEDLNLEELLEYYQELKRVQKEITDQLASTSVGPSMPSSHPSSSVQHQVKEEKR
uniref:Uncharacterized protein n=1 Tax=Avena sativa TaxID=4498 RepID=A0ACD5T8Z6_AVESA